MSDDPNLEAAAPNLFSKPTVEDLELLNAMRPLCHQIFHAVRYLLEQRAELSDNEEEVKPEDVVYYGLTAAALIGVECQGLENEELCTVVSKVNEQCSDINSEFAFPTPIGSA